MRVVSRKPPADSGQSAVRHAVGQRERHDVRHVARRGQHGVVSLRSEATHVGAQCGPEVGDGRHVGFGRARSDGVTTTDTPRGRARRRLARRPSARCRRWDGCRRSACLGGQRAVLQQRLDLPDDPALRAADVGDQRSAMNKGGHLPDLIDDLGHGRADDDQLRAGQARLEILRALRDGADAMGHVEAHRPAADAHDVFGQPARRRAKPTDPPISPTPTMATVFQRFKRCSPSAGPAF